MKQKPHKIDGKILKSGKQFKCHTFIKQDCEKSINILDNFYFNLTYVTQIQSLRLCSLMSIHNFDLSTIFSKILDVNPVAKENSFFNSTNFLKRHFFLDVGVFTCNVFQLQFLLANCIIQFVGSKYAPMILRQLFTLTL